MPDFAVVWTERCWGESPPGQSQRLRDERRSRESRHHYSSGSRAVAVNANKSALQFSVVIIRKLLVRQKREVDARAPPLPCAGSPHLYRCRARSHSHAARHASIPVDGSPPHHLDGTNFGRSPKSIPFTANHSFYNHPKSQPRLTFT